MNTTESLRIKLNVKRLIREAKFKGWKRDDTEKGQRMKSYIYPMIEDVYSTGVLECT